MKKLLVFLGICALVLVSIGTALAVQSVTVEPNSLRVPEPATLVLFGTGLIGLAAVMRKVKKR